MTLDNILDSLIEYSIKLGIAQANGEAFEANHLHFVVQELKRDIVNENR